MQPIFSNSFLSHYLAEFKLSSITNIRTKILIIKGLIEELESGKLQSLKEEEIKPRFLHQFFGDILDFNYNNISNWFLREEKNLLLMQQNPILH